MARVRKSEEVLQSARRLFLDQGFEATSVADLAADASVSKATVYSNFADKDAVLQVLVERLGREATAILQAALAPLQLPGPLPERLIEVAKALVNGVLRPEVVQLRRLAIAESARRPEVGRIYWERGPGATLDLLSAALQDLQEQGALRLPDPRVAAEQFLYGLLGPLQDRALLLPQRMLTEEENTARAESAVRALLRESDETHPEQGFDCLDLGRN